MIPKTMTEKKVSWEKQRKKEKSKKYYQDNKEKLRKIDQDWCRWLSKEEKNKKEQRKNWYKNIFLKDWRRKKERIWKKILISEEDSAWENMPEEDNTRENLEKKILKKYVPRRQTKKKKVYERIHE